jgi:poly-gamma-glutamate capsule biosynthesis protein CapA/YwtB (metallophosphatase superfamily)
MVAGFYTDIKTCARDAASILEPDDYVLLKGSRRANDFGQIRSSLLSAIQRQHELPPFTPGKRGLLSNSRYGLQAVDAESGETLLSAGNTHIQVNRGLGSLLLLALLLENIARGKMKLNEYVTINSSSAREAKASAAIGFEEGEQVSLYTLLSLLVCRNSPDVALALAETMSDKTSEALKSLKNLARQLNLSASAVENISGRPTTKPQYFTVTDLSKVGRYFFSLPPQYSKILNTTMVEYKGRLFNSTSNLVASGKIYGGFLFGPSNGEGTVLTYIGGRKVVISVCGARDSFQRDYLLAEAIDRLAGTGDRADNPMIRRGFNLPVEQPSIIQFIGDTYFGEDYTIKRQRRGEEDALTKYGYDYSFEVLQPFLAQGSLNIANFEGVLTDLTASPLKGIKPFVLGGRIQESIRSLKNNHIHAVTLGNNHAMDYGSHGLKSTLQAFNEGDIPSAGAGLTGRDASEPLRISIGDGEIVIYSGYWYRRPAHYEFESYAMGNQPGVACLNGELMERIAKDKRTKSSQAFTILVAHWGTDYGPILKEQMNYAKTFMDCGADLIIGHGAHLMQGIQQINGKWVLYSIGNGVFNSNGEYQQRKMPPYSYLLQLRIQEKGEKCIRLYPIFTDNLKTFWQPRFVTEEEFRDVIAYQTQLGTPIDQFDIGMDAYGYYTEVKI